MMYDSDILSALRTPEFVPPIANAIIADNGVPWLNLAERPAESSGYGH